MSLRSTSRLCLLAVAVWLSGVPAFAQDTSVTLKLSAAEVAEIARLIDQPQGPQPPQAYWDLQTTIDKALQANPAAARAVLSLRRAGR
jgi:hypothetical protein